MNINEVFPADIDKEVKERVERKRAEKDWEITIKQNGIAELIREKNKLEEKVNELFRWMLFLQANGFEVRYGNWTDCLTVVTTKERLTELYKMVGRFDGKAKSTTIINARKKLVEISMQCVKYPFLNVEFQIKLKGTERCKIKVVKTRRTTHELVCEV